MCCDFLLCLFRFCWLLVQKLWIFMLFVLKNCLLFCFYISVWILQMCLNCCCLKKYNICHSFGQNSIEFFVVEIQYQTKRLKTIIYYNIFLFFFEIYDFISKTNQLFIYTYTNFLHFSHFYNVKNKYIRIFILLFKVCK